MSVFYARTFLFVFPSRKLALRLPRRRGGNDHFLGHRVGCSWQIEANVTTQALAGRPLDSADIGQEFADGSVSRDALAAPSQPEEMT
jgi:hypothetical protein